MLKVPGLFGAKGEVEVGLFAFPAVRDWSVESLRDVYFKVTVLLITEESLVHQ